MDTVFPYSVLMSVYKNDNPIWLNEALDSIFQQTLPPAEVIIVIDGPVPQGVTETICAFKTRFNILKSVLLEKNMGLGYALKVGLQHCTCEYVARMDSDDVSCKNRMEKQILCFQMDSQLSIIGGFIQEFDNDSKKNLGIRSVPCDDKEIKKYIRHRCPFNHMSVMFKKSAVYQAGSYQEWHYNEDYYLWIRMLLSNCKFQNIPDILVYVRTGQDMYRRRGGWKYFRSEAKLQTYMLKHHIIGIPRYFCNVLIRFILQVLMPNRIRGIVFQKFARRQKRERHMYE